jgi:hypothetical protein
MRVYIPSTQRAVAAMAPTSIASVLAAASVPVSVVVPPLEYPDYSEQMLAHDRKGYGINIVSSRDPDTSEEIRGISDTRRFIGEVARRRGEVMFCMMDDDIHFSERRGPDTTRLMKLEQPISVVTDLIEEKLQDFAHVSVSMRQGNNNIGPVEQDGGSLNVRTCRVLAYQTEAFLAMQHGRCQFMEDFDINLQLLRAGYDNFNLGYFAQDQAQTQAPGGCSGTRTHATHEAAAHKLKELHPDFVTLVQKQNRTGGEFGTRTEVRIAWKKARKSAQ